MLVLHIHPKKEYGTCKIQKYCTPLFFFVAFVWCLVFLPKNSFAARIVTIFVQRQPNTKVIFSMTLWKTWETVVLVLAVSSSATTAFSPQRYPARPSTTLALTSEEILAKSRQAAGQPLEDSLPMVFDDIILKDFQEALLTLEKRVQDGPGSLESAEIDTLTEQLNRIVEEMHQNAHRRHQKPTRGQSPPESSSSTAAPPQMAAATAPPTQREAPVAGSATVSPPAASVTSVESDDEGPAYDGSGGMGQPRGTVNTYIIEGMDEMTSDEYRLALQQSIIDKQRARRAAGKVGARGSLDYMNSLSPDDTDAQERDGDNKGQNGPGKSWRGWSH